MINNVLAGVGVITIILVSGGVVLRICSALEDIRLLEDQLESTQRDVENLTSECSSLRMRIWDLEHRKEGEQDADD